MIEFTCKVCGEKGEAKLARKLYCSPRCKMAAHRQISHSDIEQLCRFNKGVFCDGDACPTCGWNPAVSAARIAELKKSHITNED